MHYNNSVDSLHKFTYLLSTLHGKGLDPIRNIKVTADNYFIAVEVLISRFGRLDVVIKNHIQQVLSDLESKCNTTCGTAYKHSLQLYYEEIVCYVHSLEHLGIQGPLISYFLCPLVLNNFPADIKLEWYKNHAESSGDVIKLIGFLANLNLLLSKLVHVPV